MLFNSMHFLIFFPVVTLLYFTFSHKIRWIWLLVASYYFYMAWNPRYALLMLTSTIITYLSGLLIALSDKIKREGIRIFLRKLWVALSFSSNLAILFFFKYFDFAVTNINYVLSQLGIQAIQPAFDVLLPVGISFYTFQALSYTMDVYRGEIYAEKNLAKYALFVSFFPQLVAGPIERSKNLLVQIHEQHRFSYERMKSGLLLMLWGYFQKLVIADRCAILVNNVFENYQNYAGFQIAIAVVFFSFQIYCDFAGYSNIATGAAYIMGFRLMENFRQPYFATSIRDYWRRWHISLGSWLRDYLYIPLGGSRCSKAKKYRNVFLTFLASGLWHGASWNFIVWGAMHGVYQIVGEMLKPFREKLFKKYIVTESFSITLWKVLITFILVGFSRIFFRAPQVSDAFGIIKRLFLEFNPWIFFDNSLYSLGLDEKNFRLAIYSIVVLMTVDGIKHLNPAESLRKRLAEQNIMFRWVFYYAAIFFVLIFGVYGPGYEASQFIYFQF